MVELRVLRRCNLSMIKHVWNVLWSALTAVLNDAFIGRIFVNWVHFDSIESTIGDVSAVSPPTTKNRSSWLSIRKE